MMRNQYTIITNIIKNGNTDDGDEKARDENKFDRLSRWSRW